MLSASFTHFLPLAFSPSRLHAFTLAVSPPRMPLLLSPCQTQESFKSQLLQKLGRVVGSAGSGRKGTWVQTLPLAQARWTASDGSLCSLAPQFPHPALMLCSSKPPRQANFLGARTLHSGPNFTLPLSMLSPLVGLCLPQTVNLLEFIVPEVWEPPETGL